MRPTVQPAEATAAAVADLPLSLRQFAHELNSLLDGALRCVALARRRLPAGEGGAGTSCGDHLDLAVEAMRRMAALLERAMGEAAALGLLASEQTLGGSARTIIALIQPVAEQHGVCLRHHVDPMVEALPAGLIEPILVNGLRNAVEAAALAPQGSRLVDLTVRRAGSGAVEISIRDTGPGVHAERSPGGHGLGLELCRRIAAALGGTVELATAPYGGGAVLTALLPVQQEGVGQPPRTGS